ncbi:cilia- and flagella-associated protein 141 isoform 1-T2 [Anomaloglossus baeobatrachus]|uniref:cilia- and flagella-associated protein 141 n=1 Tax=Anomaloglossus baeobatrachus TaxID=238106 RepID=UPI003F4FA2B3
MMLRSRTFRDCRTITEKESFLKEEALELERQRSLQYMCDWKEDARGVSAARHQQRQDTQQQQEVQMAKKELVMLRRAALRCLFEEEFLQYQEALQRLGKTFYVQRL